MLRVSDSTIQLTRGDSAILSVDVKDETTGEPYHLNPDDTLRLTIKRKVTDEDFVIQKVLNGSTVFKMEPSDTEGLNFGPYLYDVELTTSDGDVYTVIVPSKFELLKEVTW